VRKRRLSVSATWWTLNLSQNFFVLQPLFTSEKDDKCADIALTAGFIMYFKSGFKFKTTFN
jgi:hypothetical protein